MIMGVFKYLPSAIWDKNNGGSCMEIKHHIDVGGGGVGNFRKVCHYCYCMAVMVFFFFVF